MKNAKRFVAAILAGAMAFSMLTPQNTLAAKNKVSYVTRAYALKQIEKKIGANVQADDMSSIKDKKVSKADQKTMSVALNADLVTPNSSGKLSPKAKATYSYVAGIIANIEQKGKSEILKNKSSKKLTKSTLNSYLKSQFPNVISKDNAKIKKGNVVVNKPLTIKDKTINGDLIIGDGVADKEVTLDNVIVQGKMIVRGGGENSIIIMGNSRISRIDVKQLNNRVSLKVRNGADVSLIFINDGSHDVDIVGSVGELTVGGADIGVSLTGATVGKITIAEDAKGASVIADKNSSVSSIELNAENSKIEGDGKVEAVNVNANDTTVTVKDAKITTKEGITAPNTGETTPTQPVFPAPAIGGVAPISGGGSSPVINPGTSGSSSSTGNNGKDDNDKGDQGITTDPSDVTFIDDVTTSEYKYRPSYIAFNNNHDEITLYYGYKYISGNISVSNFKLSQIQYYDDGKNVNSDLTSEISEVKRLNDSGVRSNVIIIVIKLKNSVSSDNGATYGLSYTASAENPLTCGYNQDDTHIVKHKIDNFELSIDDYKDYDGSNHKYAVANAFKSDDNGYMTINTPISLFRSGLYGSDIVAKDQNGNNIGIQVNQYSPIENPAVVYGPEYTSFHFDKNNSNNLGNITKISITSRSGRPLLDLCGDPVENMNNIEIKTIPEMSFGDNAYYTQYNDAQDGNLVSGELEIAINDGTPDTTAFIDIRDFVIKADDNTSIVLSPQNSNEYFEQKYNGQWYLIINSGDFANYDLSGKSEIQFSYKPKFFDNILCDASEKPVKLFDGFKKLQLTTIDDNFQWIKYNTDERILSGYPKVISYSDTEPVVTGQSIYVGKMGIEFAIDKSKIKDINKAKLYYVFSEWAEVDCTSNFVMHGKLGDMHDGVLHDDGKSGVISSGVVNFNDEGTVQIPYSPKFITTNDQATPYYGPVFITGLTLFAVLDDGNGNISAAPARKSISYKEQMGVLNKKIANQTIDYNKDENSIRVNYDYHLDEKSVVDASDYKLVWKTYTSHDELEPGDISQKDIGITSVNAVNTPDTEDDNGEGIFNIDYVKLSLSEVPDVENGYLVLSYSPAKGRALRDIYGVAAVPFSDAEIH